MRVLLADDDPNVRSALRFLLENERDIAIAGECSTADGLSELLHSTRADVVLLDWDLPGLQASGVVARLRVVHPAPLLLALSCRPEQRAEASRAGITRFVCKGDPPESLLTALNEARRAMSAAAELLDRRS